MEASKSFDFVEQCRYWAVLFNSVDIGLSFFLLALYSFKICQGVFC